MVRVLYDNSLSVGERIILFVALVAALFFAIILHEVAHAYVALLNGDRTAKANGRLTLNPVKHFDPLGFLMLMFVGFGYAKPVPVNYYNFKRRRIGIFTVSIAGIATNIIFAFISCMFYTVMLKTGGAGSFYMLGLNFFWYFALFNVFLCFFNLLPFFPLDGFNMLSSFLRHNNKVLKFLREYGQYILLFLIGLSIAVDYVGLPYSWWQNLDVLGLYLNFFAGGVRDGFLWFWRIVFGI